MSDVDDSGPAETNKQKLVDTMALAISTAESVNEHAMKKSGAIPMALFNFRKGGGIHVKDGALVLEKVGEAMHYQGMAAACLRDAHADLERIRAYPDFALPEPTKGGTVTPLGNGGGKNGWPQK